MSPPALPILNQSVDMSELARDAAVHYRSAISGLSHQVGTEQSSGDFSGYPKFDRFRRETRSAENAIVSVRGLKRYGAGWNGFGAEAPREAAIRDSLEFLSRTSSDAVFQVDLDEDGAVNLAVDVADVRILLTFEGDGRIALSRRTASAWLDMGTYPIRGSVGRAAPDVERLISGV
ncbi:hypothetical protein [Methylobacterium sp. Leaf111]|uniref:hypothetical protein n=1 Tax=Methylobacterium sp. Leaf111 TaxID=1736257 RepID=UPI0012E78A90|nr:hypothetical protein [Methylobacterium sp. Leaf111]